MNPLQDNNISRALKHLGAIILLKALAILRRIFQLIYFIWHYLIVAPLSFIGGVVLFSTFLHLYKFYLILKTRIFAKLKPSKNTFLFLFSTRYLIHAVVIILTIVVTTKNLSASEIDAEDFGKKSPLASIVQPLQEEDLIIETSETLAQEKKTYLEETGTVGGTPKVAEEDDSPGIGETASVTQEGAIIKPGIASTTLGNRPRDTVAYHVVKEGETVSEIAELYGVSTNTLLWENRLGARDFIKSGDILTILPTTGVSHQVKSGDTLDKIASRYGTTVDEIVEYNELPSAEAIAADDILLIPGGEPPPPPAPAPTSTTRFSYITDIFSPSNAPDSSATGSGSFGWPTPGRKINQYYGWRHTGLDIDTASSPIYASDSGRVTAVGWSGGYGNRITIDHGNGYTTLYGHLSAFHVRVGDSVSRGQVIGTSGCTGWCTGDHLHFEIRIGGDRKNPLSYL